MLKIITFFSFAIIFVNTQDVQPILECRNQTNHYYCYTSPRDRGNQGEPVVPDNSMVELLRSEFANLTMRLADLEDQNRELIMRLADLEDQNRELTTRPYDVEYQNRELTTRQQNLINITTNCNENYITASGVYFLRENVRLKPVYCEVETVGRNWLVFQKRVDGRVDFYRNWREYQRGFGDVEGNYWLGLDAIHVITSSGSYQLRIDLEDWEYNTAYALYSSFSVGDESSNYRLSVSGYSGTAGNSLSHHNNQQFSTFDRDNDAYNGENCAVSYHGAWWYGSCLNSNLNGNYQRGSTSSRSISWVHWRRRYFSLKRSVMKIRPN